VYKGCARINYKIVPVNILNKYLNYGTSGTEFCSLESAAASTERMKAFSNVRFRWQY